LTRPESHIIPDVGLEQLLLWSLKEHADLFAEDTVVHVSAVHISAGQEHLASLWPQKTRRQLQERGLP
jgi:hypothetical protein